MTWRTPVRVAADWCRPRRWWPPTAWCSGRTTVTCTASTRRPADCGGGCRLRGDGGRSHRPARTVHGYSSPAARPDTVRRAPWCASVTPRDPLWQRLLAGVFLVLGVGSLMLGVVNVAAG